MPQPQLQNVSLADLISGVVKVYQPQLQKLKMRSSTEFPAEVGSITADPDLLHRALSNLVLNAIDVMPDGGKLGLRTSNVSGSARIEVSDTGTGLTPEECARLFTPYYTSKSHGTGLGLAIVQSIVSDHGGRMERAAANRGKAQRLSSNCQSGTECSLLADSTHV